MRRIIDAHLDLAWNALSWNRDLTEDVAAIRASERDMADDDARRQGTVSLPDMRRGGVAVCLGTILVRAKRHVQPARGHRRIDVDVATQEIASAVGQGQAAYYRELARRGQVTMIGTRGQLREHWDTWGDGAGRPIGVILAMEGADPIVEPRQAEWWWDQGLRAVGLAHYGRSHYAVGTGDDGPLTAKGIELLRVFDRLGMILDLTHSSDTSFWQALDRFHGPVLASHNNCRALVPGDRQYSDEQVKAIVTRGGVIGCAFDAWMLKPGFVIGQTHGSEVPLSAAVDHIDRVCQLAGNSRHVAIGSDLDGGFGTEQSPAGIDTIADLQKLDGLLAARGYSPADIDNVFHRNWLDFFNKALP